MENYTEGGIGGDVTDARRRELELLSELLLSKADLKVITEVGKMSHDIRGDMAGMRDDIKSIPPLIDKKIEKYNDRQTRRRQWMTRTLLIVATLALTAISLVFARLAG